MTGMALEGSFFRGHLVPPFVGLKPSTKILLYELVSYDYVSSPRSHQRKGYSFPGNDALARWTGFSESTVKRGLTELEHLLYIVRHREYRGRGHRDYRFAYINYPKLVRGHEFVLKARQRRNHKDLETLESECSARMQTDDVSFLARLFNDRTITSSELATTVESSYLRSNRRLISELSMRVEGLNLAPSKKDCRT